METAALLVLLIVCATLRIVNLGALPVFIDEATYAQAARIVGAHPGPNTFFIQSTPNFGFNPPLFSWLAAPFTRLLPDPLVAARLASACIGVVGMVATWRTGRLLWGPLAGLLAGTLYALSPFVVFYNRLALLDGLLATCGAGALFFASRLARRGRVGDALGLGLCVAAAMLTKLFAVNLLLLPLLAALVACRDQRAVVSRGAALAIVVGLAPLPYVYQNGWGLHGHLNTRNLTQEVSVVWGQAVLWADSLWLYLTPPVLLAALVGLWAVRRDRLGLLVGVWALLGTLDIVAVPNKLFAPRYELYIAVPVVLLGARGLLTLSEALSARLRRGAPLWLVLAGAVTLVSIPAAMFDATTIGAPARTALVPFDHWQYVTGWPAGGTLTPAIAYLRRQASRRPITVIAENIPLYMLEVSMAGDKNIVWRAANFGHPRGLQTVVGGAVRSAGAANVYVVNHHTTGAHPDRRLQPKGRYLVSDRRVLAVVVDSRGPDGISIYEVYHVATKQAPCRTLFGVRVGTCG
jgi:4-amino-4-deoxy-L-arabinose transferase-like glycosyltransferase